MHDKPPELRGPRGGVVRELPDRGATDHILQAITRQMNEHDRALRGNLAAQIDKLRSDLLIELEALVERRVEQKLARLMPGLVNRLGDEVDEDADSDEAKYSYLSFRGQGDHVTIENPFDDPTAFTIAMWVRPSVIEGSAARGFVGKTDEKLWMPGLWLCPADKALRYDSMSTTSQRHQDSLGGFFEGDTWIHVAWVKRARTYEFYKNGELVATRPAPKAVATIGPDYWIGGSDGSWRGHIAEVSIWSVPRSREEIDLEMRGRPPRDAEGLSGFWSLDEGSGDTACDISENNNQGTIVGAVWERSEEPLPGGDHMG